MKTMKTLLKKYPMAEPTTIGDNNDVCIFTCQYKEIWEDGYVRGTKRKVKRLIKVRIKDKILSASIPQYPNSFRDAVKKAWDDAIKRHG